MVKSSKTTKSHAVKGTRGYKKCIVAVIKRTKFKTPKQARKVFGKAVSVCLKRLTTAKKTTAPKHKCKYGRLKSGKKLCRKTPIRK